MRIVLSTVLAAGLQAQVPQTESAAPQEATQQDPLKRPLSEKQKRARQKALDKEIGNPYKIWLEQDVPYIITPEEREAFKRLSNDQERDAFIEAFWLRRDPTPDTVENEYRDEHYRRITYANEHFSAGIPGWKTDRGRIYILHGQPDSIDSHPSGGAYERPIEEGGGSTSTYPFEQWRYRHLDDVGQEVILEFVDTCMCGDYHLTVDRSEKDALLMVPGAGLTLYEQQNLADKSQRFSGSGLERIGPGPMGQSLMSDQFERLRIFTAVMAPPKIRFKDLENELVSHTIHTNLLPFDVRVDFVRVTGDTVMVPVALQVRNRDVVWNEKDGVQRMNMNILGRLTTMTGRIVQTFEDPVTDAVASDLLPQIVDNSHIYAKALPLRPGRYRLDVVVKDVNGDRVGVWTKGIVVPEFSDDRLTASSLIIADRLEKVPARNVGTGDFVIGDTKVRPRVEPANGQPVSFPHDGKINFWMQVYNLGISEQTKKPSAQIEYEIVNAAGEAVIHTSESTDTMGNVGQQLTLEKTLALNKLPHGTYQIRIKVTDNVAHQTIAPQARFAVE